MHFRKTLTRALWKESLRLKDIFHTISHKLVGKGLVLNIRSVVKQIFRNRKKKELNGGSYRGEKQNGMKER